MDIDGLVLGGGVGQDAESALRVPLEGVEVGYAVASEEGAGYRAVLRVS